MLKYIKNIFRIPVLAIALLCIFVLEICFLNDIKELGGSLYSRDGSHHLNVADANNSLPHDRRKTAPEIRKNILIKKTDSTHAESLSKLIGMIEPVAIFAINLDSKYSDRNLFFYNHEDEIRKFKYHQHGPPEYTLS